jgi:hypothetical protein
MGIGGAVFAGNSKLFEGPLGVVRVGFKGYDLGKTTADANLTPDQDVKDIMYQQDGTKAADHVRTGIDYVLAVTFGEIKTGLLKLLMAGISSLNASPAEDSGTIDRSIYQSMRDNEGGALKVAAVDENGEAFDDLEHILNFYEAIPIVNAELVNWGADTQRNFPVEFRIKWHKFGTGESVTKVGAFGYWGDPTIEDVPALVWPDVDGPQIVTAIAVSATSLEVTFNENIAFQSAFAADDYMCDIDGAYKPPTAGVIATVKLTLTFAAATFTVGDVIRFFMTATTLKDTATPANLADEVLGRPVTNSVV